MDKDNNYIYIIYPLIKELDIIKIGYWSGNIIELYKRYTTYYTNNIIIYLWKCYDKQCEKDIHTLFSKQKICKRNEIYNKNNFDNISFIFNIMFPFKKYYFKYKISKDIICQYNKLYISHFFNKCVKQLNIMSELNDDELNNNYKKYLKNIIWINSIYKKGFIDIDTPPKDSIISYNKFLSKGSSKRSENDIKIYYHNIKHYLTFE